MYIWHLHEILYNQYCCMEIDTHLWHGEVFVSIVSFGTYLLISALTSTAETSEDTVMWLHPVFDGGVIIGIDHDTVCAGVVGNAIRHNTSCAGRRAAACGRAGRNNPCWAGLQYQPRQRRPYKWSIYILPRSQFYKKQGKLAFSTSCTAVRRHRRLRNDAWRRDS